MRGFKCWLQKLKTRHNCSLLAHVSPQFWEIMLVWFSPVSKCSKEIANKEVRHLLCHELMTNIISQNWGLIWAKKEHIWRLFSSPSLSSKQKATLTCLAYLIKNNTLYFTWCVLSGFVPKMHLWLYLFEQYFLKMAKSSVSSSVSGRCFKIDSKGWL